MLAELSVMEPCYHAGMEVISGSIPVVEVAQRYGVSRKTVHAWLRRYRQDGLPGLADRSHGQRHHPGQLAAGIKAGRRRALNSQQPPPSGTRSRRNS
jgi:transposase-like protein